MYATAKVITINLFTKTNEDGKRFANSDVDKLVYLKPIENKSAVT